MKNPESPFPGPVPLTEKYGVFGRAKETAELIDRLIADRFVLLYSPSGAGKSSLLEAGVKPKLKNKVANHKTIRVSFEVKDRGNLNRYTASCLRSLEIEADDRTRLADYLPQPKTKELLVFDQFEEILTIGTADKKGEDERKEFFRQLGDLLQVPGRMAVFAAREDYLAPLDPYLDWVPQLLSSRMRLNVLSRANAEKSIRDAINATGTVTIADEAVTALATDLAAGGGWVEPVQLQVVCKRLWIALDEGTTTISPRTLDALKKAGADFSTETALQLYYKDVVEDVANESGVAERRIRDWFEQKLISASSVRMQAEVGPEDTAGLPKSAADLLEKAHLVRSDERFTRRTRELTHDRLVRPILENNRVWRTKLSALQREAEDWEKYKRPGDRLLRGSRLREAKRWAGQHMTELLDFEKDFLRESRKAARGRLLLRALMATCFLGMLGVVVLMLRERAAERVHAVEESASTAASLVPEQPDSAAVVMLEAEEASRDDSVPGKLTRWLAPDLTRHATAVVNSAFLAVALHDPLYLGALQQTSPPADCLWFDDDALIAVVGGESGRRVANLKKRTIDAAAGTGTPERCGGAPAANRERIDLPPKWKALRNPEFYELVYNPGPNQTVYQTLVPIHSKRVAVDPTGKWVGWTGIGSNYVYVARVGDPNQKKSFSTGDLQAFCIRFSPNGSTLAEGGRDRTVRLFNLDYHPETPDDAAETMILRAHTDTVLDVEFSPDGTRLYSSGADRRLVEWAIPSEADGWFGGTTAGFAPERTIVTAESGMPLKIHRSDGSDREMPLDPGQDADLIAVSAAGKAALTYRNGVVRAADLNALHIGKGAPESAGATAIAISADGKWMASATAQGKIFRWKMNGLEAPQRNDVWQIEPPEQVESLTLSADGRLVVSGDAGNRIRFWADKQYWAEWRGQGLELPKPIVTRQTPQSLAFSPGERLLASLDESRSLQVWDRETGVGGDMQFRGTGRPAAIGFTEDGSALEILRGFGTGVIKIALDPKKFHETACALVPPRFDVPALGSLVNNPQFKPNCPGY